MDEFLKTDANLLLLPRFDVTPSSDVRKTRIYLGEETANNN